MPVTITYANAKPVVGGSADTWGGILNTQSDQTKVDLDALAVVVNTSEPLAANALPKSGGTMTGDIALGDPTPGSASSAGFRGAPVVSIDADRTFGATDSGKCIRLTGTTTRTWTIPPAVFGVGTTILIRSFSTQALTIARGVGVELRIPASSTNANRSVASYGYASIFQEASNVWIISGAGVS